jgi:hypothetical protein
MSNIKKINNLKGLRTGPLGTATLNAVHAGHVAVHEEACVARTKPKPKQEPRNAPGPDRLAGDQSACTRTNKSTNYQCRTLKKKQNRHFFSSDLLGLSLLYIYILKQCSPEAEGAVDVV